LSTIRAEGEFSQAAAVFFVLQGIESDLRALVFELAAADRPNGFVPGHEHLRADLTGCGTADTGNRYQNTGVTSPDLHRKITNPLVHDASLSA
jgi:hypothetical protein